MPVTARALLMAGVFLTAASCRDRPKSEDGTGKPGAPAASSTVSGRVKPGIAPRILVADPPASGTTSPLWTPRPVPPSR